MGNERLVLIRSRNGGLILQIMFYGDQVPKADDVRLSGEELKLGAGLIEKLSSENFEPQAYDDEYRNRVLALIDEKVKGREITVAPKPPPSGMVIDLMAALRESMKTVERGKKRSDQRKRRKA